MNVDKQRRRVLILEYFELLGWNKSGCSQELPIESFDSNEELQSIKQDLHRIQDAIIEKRSLISFVQEEIDRIKPIISSTEGSLLQLREQIVLTRKEKSQSTQTAPYSDFFEQSNKSEIPAIPPPRLSETFRQLFLGIGNDIRTIYLDLKHAIATLNFLVLLQYVFAIFIVAIIFFIFTDLVSFTFYMSLTLYIIWKLISIFGRHKKEWKHKYKNSEIERQQKARQQENLKFQTQQQELASNLHELEQQYVNYEQFLNQQKLRVQELTDQIRAAHTDLIDLEYGRNQQTDNYQRTIDELIEQWRRSKVERLLHLERLAQQWLKEDINNLIDQAQRKLNLIDSKFTGELRAIKMTPIRALGGVTPKTFPSLLIKDDIVGNLENKKISELHISPKDFRSEPTYDRKGRIYGVYEFLVVFLCQNFLSYYKCYFNFIKSEPIDEEYCEYLYDSVVSIKIQDKSSVNMKKIDAPKQIYSKRLIISTNDGKEIGFRIHRNRVESHLSSKLSELDTAATQIRTMLR